MSAREGANAAAKEPGFWPNYREPSKIARAIERPLAAAGWQSGVLNAYATTKQVRT